MIEDTEQAYSVTFSLKRNLAGSLQEPDDYIVNISGRIYADEEEVGRMKGYIIQVERALENKQDLFEACGAHSQTVEDYYEALFISIREKLKNVSKSNWIFFRLAIF